MIVIGYQGIGKSTLAKLDLRFVDLESGNFWVDGKRADDWYKPYCQIAEHLSKQGYIVFTSSHEVVRKQLENTNEVVALVYPATELKDAWIDKLEKRYEESGLEKDYKALMNAEDRYEENIKELIGSYCGYRTHHMVLTKMDYDLEAALIHLKNELDGLLGR
jgi:ABC-type oligopeptide transport system ATPase subunit